MYRVDIYSETSQQWLRHSLADANDPNVMHVRTWPDRAAAEAYAERVRRLEGRAARVVEC